MSNFVRSAGIPDTKPRVLRYVTAVSHSSAPNIKCQMTTSLIKSKSAQGNNLVRDAPQSCRISSDLDSAILVTVAVSATFHYHFKPSWNYTCWIYDPKRILRSRTRYKNHHSGSRSENGQKSHETVMRLYYHLCGYHGLSLHVVVTRESLDRPCHLRLLGRVLSTPTAACSD